MAPKKSKRIIDIREEPVHEPRSEEIEQGTEEQQGDTEHGESGQDSMAEMFAHMNPTEFERAYQYMQELHQQRQQQPPPHHFGPGSSQSRRPVSPPKPDIASVKYHYKELNKIDTPKFDGRSDPDAAENWLSQIEKKFAVMEVPENIKPLVAPSFLIAEGDKWWDGISPIIAPRGRQITWEEFRKAFLDQYFPQAIRVRKMQEFRSLKQEPNMSVLEYFNLFNALGRFDPSVMADETSKMIAFKSGLHGQIQTMISSAYHMNLQAMVNACLGAEEDIMRRRAEMSSDPRCVRQPDHQGRPFRPFRPARPQVHARGASPSSGASSFSPRPSQPRICPNCGRAHFGECHWRSGACFSCGQIGHKTYECPNRQQRLQQQRLQQQPSQSQQSQRSGAGSSQRSGTGSGRPNPNSRVFALTEQEAEGTEDVVTGSSEASRSDWDYLS